MSCFSAASLHHKNDTTFQYEWKSVQLPPPICNIRWLATATEAFPEPDSTTAKAHFFEEGDKFVKSWLSNKDRLLSTKVGSMESQQWEEARMLIRTFRTHPKLKVAVSNRVEYIFEVLDRLYQEVVHQHQTPLQNQETKVIEMFLNGDDTDLLECALIDWTNHIIAKTWPTKSNKDIMDERKQRARKGLWKPMTDSTCLGTLSTAAMLERVNNYFRVGLFEKSLKPYSMILYTMNKVDDPESAPYRAHDIYLQLVEDSNHNLEHAHHPDRSIIRDLIEIWAQSWLPESRHRAEEYLHSLMKWSKESKREELQPNPENFCGVMEAHGRSNEPKEAFKRIMSLLDEMKATCPSTEMDSRVYTRVCHALAECNLPEGAAAMRSILDEMCQAITDINSSVPRPGQYTFSTMITAYGQLGLSKDAEAVFHQMEKLAEQHRNDESLRPDAMTLSALLWAYAKSGDTTKVESVAARLFTEMERQPTSDGSDLMNKALWRGVLVSFATSGRPDAGNIIAAIIKKLFSFSHEKGGQHVVDTTILNTLLQCYAFTGTKDAAKLAEEHFNWMENQEEEQFRPDGNSYLNVISAWCKAGDAVQGERKLREFLAHDGMLHNHNSAIDEQHFNIVIDALSKSRYPRAAEKAGGLFDLMQSSGIRPNVVSYTSLILAWSRSKAHDSARNVVHIFETMKNDWKGGNAHAKPNNYSYNAIIWSLGQSSDPAAIEMAENYFHEMEQEDVERCTSIYCSLMTGWMKRNRPDKVEALYQETKERPTHQMHTVRLQAWSKAGNPEMTTNALNDWIQAGEAKSVDEMPETQAFNAVLTSFLRSGRSDAAEKIEHGLRQMIQLDSSGRVKCYPDTRSYTTAIAAFANSGSSSAGERAMFWLNEMKRAAQDRNDANILPSFISYAKTIQAIIRSGDGQGEQTIYGLMEELFQSNDPSVWKLRDIKGTLKLLGHIRRDLESSRWTTSSEERMMHKLNELESKTKLSNQQR